MGLDGEARQRLTATDATSTIGGWVAARAPAALAADNFPEFPISAYRVLTGLGRLTAKWRGRLPNKLNLLVSAMGFEPMTS